MLARSREKFVQQCNKRRAPQKVTSTRNNESRSGAASTMTQDRKLAVVFVLWTLYMLASSLTAPLMPYLWGALNGTTHGYGIMMSESGALQLVGSLLSGPLIDRFGPKLWLGVSLAALSLSCAVTGLASATWMMYVSRLPAILELGPLSTRALIAERTSDQDRVRMLGYVGACMGAAFAVGPTLGGWLTQRSYRLCAWSAAALAFLGFAAIPLIPPANKAAGFTKLHPVTLQVAAEASAATSAVAARAASIEPAGSLVGSRDMREDSEEIMQSQVHDRWTAIRHMWITFCLPGVRSLTMIKVLVGFPLSMMQTTLSLLLQKHYQLAPEANGYVMSWFGILFVLVQSLAVGPISKRLSVQQVMLAFGWGGVLSFAGLALCGFSIWAFVAAMAPLVLCALLLETVTTAQLTKVVPSESQGTVLAIEASMFGACTTVAPSVATWLFEQIGFSSLGVAGSTTYFVMVCLVYLGVLKC
ncbi:hypothetical protein WJX73_007695 [Symbiochloris irregularis]|uniref:Major facilitator superfamily (MFS) profile domain-containing protein n=1 Tax=Symbiochloris irregularis TaxID=706552 RepID=A0AAW1PQJ9_9CHLO